MRLIVKAVNTLDYGFVQLVDGFSAFGRVWIDLVNALDVQLHFEAARPASVAPQPRAYVVGMAKSFHGPEFTTARSEPNPYAIPYETLIKGAAPP